MKVVAQMLCSLAILMFSSFELLIIKNRALSVNASSISWTGWMLFTDELAEFCWLVDAVWTVEYMLSVLTLSTTTTEYDLIESPSLYR